MNSNAKVIKLGDFDAKQYEPESTKESTPKVEPVAVSPPPSWNLPAKAWVAIIVAVTLVSSIFVWNQRQEGVVQTEALNEANDQLVQVESDLRSTATLLEQAKAEEASAEALLTELEQELQTVQENLNQAIDPELYAALEASEARLIEEVSSVKVELAAQTTVVEQLQADFDAVELLNRELQAKVNVAQAKASVEAVNAAEASAALAAAHSLVTDRIEGAFRILSGSTLGTKVYPLPEVVYRIDRPGLADNETQTFSGAGEIGFVNNMDQARIDMFGDTTVQAVIPLPKVENYDEVKLEGVVSTDREQLARIGGRWGEQTELFVNDVARIRTRELACQDVETLRAEMSRLIQLTAQLSNGYRLNVRWIDDQGNMRVSVTDEQLLANAC